MSYNRKWTDLNDSKIYGNGVNEIGNDHDKL